VSNSIVSAPRAARPAPPPIRCGVCQWSVFIRTNGRAGGKHYAVVPLGAQPGFRGVWRVRTKGTETTYTVAQPKAGPAACSCPDHEQTGAHCKHIMALAVLGLVRRPKVKTAPSRAKGLKAHAKNARAAIAEARQLAPEARRHLAAMGPEPAPLRGTDRRAAILGMPKAQDLEIDLAQRAIAAEASARPAPAGIVLPEGWQLGGAALRPAAAPAAKALPPVPAGSFAVGFRQAVADHLALKRGDLVECAACRYPFDPETEGSAPLALCGPCLDEEKGGRS
jgi:hypothetical protein